MLLFGDGTLHTSGRWSLVRLSDGPCPLCCHVRGAPAHRCLVPVPPSFAYGVVLPARQAPIGTAGDGSQSQPAPVSGKLLPTYSAAGETLFLRKSLALPASQGGKKNPGCPFISVIPPFTLPGAEGREAELGGGHGERTELSQAETHDSLLHRHGNSLDAAGWICAAHLPPGSGSAASSPLASALAAYFMGSLLSLF